MIYLASDHAGFHLKEIIKQYLQSRKIAVEDCGPAHEDPQDDYPDFIFPAAQKVAQHPDEHRGIFIGGSGQGEAMAANKVAGIRAAVFYGGTDALIQLSREHNNANVLSLGARFLTATEAWNAVELWLTTPFSGDERHMRRIQKISTFEQ